MGGGGGTEEEIGEGIGGMECGGGRGGVALQEVMGGGVEQHRVDIGETGRGERGGCRGRVGGKGERGAGEEW